MFYLQFPTDGKITFATAGHFTAQNHPVHPSRILGSAVLLMGLEGTYPIAQDGRPYVLSEGTYMILFPHHHHGGTSPASDAQSHFWCHFYLPTPEVHTVTDQPDVLSLSGNGNCILPEFGTLAHTEKYRILFRQLIDASQNHYPDPAAQARICDAYITILLQELSQEHLQNLQRTRHGNPGSKQRALVADITEYLRTAACDDRLTVQALAEKYRYNAKYLTQIFKAETGMTLVGYINARRIEEAKKLLLNTDLSVEKIAAAAGYRDSKYFMKTFKRLCHVTPSEYRQSFFRRHVNIQ